MREKFLYLLALVAAILLARNLYVILLRLPDEVQQGAIWRIFTFHLPAAIASGTGFALALVFSTLYLWRRNLKWDAVAAATTEVAWDPRLTSYFIALLIYAGYLMLRRVIDEPTTRARLSAVLSVFGFVDMIIVWKSIEWWKTLHPGPVLSIRTGGGRIDPAFESAAWWNVMAFAVLGLLLIMMRMRQEDSRREIDAMRRIAHTV
jgi:heme exporter protein C